MYEQKPVRLFVHCALPQMAGLLVNSVYFIVDGVFIGHRLGSRAMAAVPLIEILIALSLALASGVGVVLSAALAQQRPREANRAFQSGLLLTALFGLLIALLGRVFLHPLCDLLGGRGEVHEPAARYMDTILILSPFLLFSFFLGGMARNDQCPRLAMVALAAGSLSNIFLDWLFMYPLSMGIRGAALATGIGPAVSVAILLPHFLRRGGRLRLGVSHARVSLFPRFLHLGFPSFIMEFTIGMIAFFVNYGIIQYGYGEEGLAAYLIVGYLSLIILTAFLGIAEGLQPAFSCLWFADRKGDARALARFSSLIVLAFGAAASLLSCLFSRAFYALFTPDDMPLRLFAARVSRLYFPGFFAAGLNILAISYCQSTARAGRSLLVSLLRACVLPPLAILILPRIDPSLLWLCHSLSEMVTLAAAAALKPPAKGA